MTNIDWSKSPKGATHAMVEDEIILRYWYKLGSEYASWWHNSEWLISGWSNEQVIDLSGKYLSGKYLNGNYVVSFVARPAEQVKPVYTQEMFDAGELPPIKSKVIIKDKFNDCWDVAKPLLEVPVTIMSRFTGLGIEKGKPIEMVVASLDDGLCCCFRADYCRPLTPSIDLIDGKAYQFDYYAGDTVQGAYDCNGKCFWVKGSPALLKHASNIQLLEVKS